MKFRIAIAAMALALCLPVHNAQAGGTFSLGAEGFFDNYSEPQPGVHVDSNAIYGSLTAGYSYSGEDWFVAADGRGSYGRDHYHSVSGSVDDIPQYEVEGRLRFGAILPQTRGVLTPYTGIGERYYLDQGDGTVTNLGFGGYDRIIYQTYIPVGATWTFHAGGWSIAPQAEYDQLIMGNVKSRIGKFTGYDIDNDQHAGYGLRGQLMFGRDMGKTRWEIGPFVRYWNIRPSEVTTGPDGRSWIEPHNTRVQAGASMRVMF